MAEQIPDFHWSDEHGLMKRERDLWWVSVGGWMSLRLAHGTGGDPQPGGVVRLAPVREGFKYQPGDRVEVAFPSRSKLGTVTAQQLWVRVQLDDVASPIDASPELLTHVAGEETGRG